MWKLLLIIGLIFSGTSEAEIPTQCKPVRYATAKLNVYRLHWAKNNGNYKFERSNVCSLKAQVGVLSGPMAGCTSGTIPTCYVEIDGNMHKVNVSLSIYHNDYPYSETKHFGIWYHLDRNSGEVTTGEAGSSNVFTQDLGLKNMGISLQSKFDSPTDGKVMRDGLVLIAEFEDKYAP